MARKFYVPGTDETDLKKVIMALQQTAAAVFGGREVLTAARTYYVATTGSDSNDGLSNTATGAFLTIQKAIDTAATLDAAGYTLTIQIADGTYTGAVSFKNVTGATTAGSLILRGNNATPSNVHINVTGDAVTSSAIWSTWDVKDLKVSSTASCLTANGAYLRYGNLVFGTAGGNHIQALTQGKIIALSGWHVAGGASAHIYAESASFIYVASYTVTFDATVAFTNFCYTLFGCTILAHAMTFTLGAFAVTGTRYAVQYNSVVYTGGGGASYFPGNSAGSTSTGGQYA